jgi:peptide deformylase
MPKQLVLVPYESGILRKPLSRVPDPLAPDIQAIIDDMLYSIDIAQLGKSAAGMAANQWGLNWQIFMYCPAGNDSPANVEVVINPSYTPINENQKEDLAFEGCFSIPGAIQRVSRYTAIAVRYQNRQGQWIDKVLEGWEARVWQHENDHVLGVLCDAKAHRTIEKIVFESPAAETAFMEDVQEKRKKGKK